MLLAAPADPGGDVLRVFAARCAGCHSPAAAKLQGDFGYVLDLQRLAADREKLLPGDPANSNLWKLVDAGNMPPNNSPTGPLNDAQKAAIKAWITAGAPAALPPPSDDAQPPPAEALPPNGVGTGAAPADGGTDPLDATDTTPASESFLAHLGRWAGESHLLLLHFPIVCLLAALFAEGRGWWRGQVSASATATFCIWTAALSAVPTVICGWVYAAAGHGAGSSLDWHRALGTSGGVLAVLTALVHSYGGTLLLPKEHALARRGFLLAAVGIVVAAAHLGGRLAFGPGFLGW